MPVPIIHPLEIIQIKKQRRHPGVISPGTLDLVYQELPKIARIMKSRELVS